MWKSSPGGKRNVQGRETHCSNGAETQREAKDSTIQRKSPEKWRKTCVGPDILSFCGWEILKGSEKKQRQALWLGRLP